MNIPLPTALVLTCSKPQVVHCKSEFLPYFMSDVLTSHYDFVTVGKISTNFVGKGC